MELMNVSVSRSRFPLQIVHLEQGAFLIYQQTSGSRNTVHV